MISKMFNKDIVDQINEGLTSEGFSSTDMVAVNQLKRDRLTEIFAYLFQGIEKYGYCVHRMVISTQVMCLIRQMDYRDSPFNESTRRELLTVGLVGSLWTADVYMDKDCVGIVLSSSEDSDKIVDGHPDLKMKFDKIRGNKETV